MKKLFIYPLIISTFVACSETNSTNNPSNVINSSDTINTNDSTITYSIGENNFVTELITNENVYPEQDELIFSYSNKSYKLEYSINVDTTQGQLSEIEGYNGEITIYKAHKVTVDLELFLENSSLWKKTVGISDLYGEHSYKVMI